MSVYPLPALDDPFDLCGAIWGDDDFADNEPDPAYIPEPMLCEIRILDFDVFGEPHYSTTQGMVTGSGAREFYPARRGVSEATQRQSMRLALMTRPPVNCLVSSRQRIWGWGRNRSNDLRKSQSRSALARSTNTKEITEHDA